MHPLKKQILNTRQQALDLLSAYFDNAVDREIWLSTPNPLLGGVSPDYMLLMGRSEKLLEFIRNSLKEGGRYEG